MQNIHFLKWGNTSPQTFKNNTEHVEHKLIKRATLWNATQISNWQKIPHYHQVSSAIVFLFFNRKRHQMHSIFLHSLQAIPLSLPLSLCIIFVYSSGERSATRHPHCVPYATSIASMAFCVNKVEDANIVSTFFSFATR